MCMLPAAERTRSLRVPELPPFDVIAMFETPAHSKGTQVNPHRSAVAITNSARALDDLDPFPRRRQALPRAGVRVPAKQLLRGRLDSRSGDEQIRPRHILQAILRAHPACGSSKTVTANRITNES